LFFDKPIWDLPDIHQNRSHLWHKKYSLPFTKILGRFACIVTSKILGIGSAERAWGDVKHLKTNKRSHLSPEAVKMQSTLYGAACVEKAESKRSESLEVKREILEWDEEDLAKLGLDRYGIDVENLQLAAQEVPKRQFRAYQEGWEKEACVSKDPVEKRKIMEKYGGLMLWDEDSKEAKTIHPRELWWSNSRNDKGWQLIVITDKFDLDKDVEAGNNDDEWEPWSLDEDTSDLHFCMRKYYRKFPSEVVECYSTKALIVKDKADDPEFEEDVAKMPDHLKPTALSYDKNDSNKGSGDELSSGSESSTELGENNNDDDDEEDDD
jgi:hypothetical protein